MPIWRALTRGTQEVSPGSINNANSVAEISNLDLQYDIDKKTLTFMAQVNSNHHVGAYNVIITFKNVAPDDGLTDEEIMQGYKPKPSLSKHEVMINCRCPSYRFRFDKANRNNHAGTGSRFPIYHRKTDRKPNNPRNLPGFCHHALELIEYLQRQGFVY